MQKEYFNMKEEASPSPSEGGDVFPQTLLSIEKKPLPQPQLQPHPPTPLRMERGWGRGFPSLANSSVHAPLHSERGRG